MPTNAITAKEPDTLIFINNLLSSDEVPGVRQLRYGLIWCPDVSQILRITHNALCETFAVWLCFVNSLKLGGAVSFGKKNLTGIINCKIM
nr:hypothetical protein [Candidatus Cloacimonadota bacterium]